MYDDCLQFARSFVAAARPTQPILSWHVRRAYPGTQPKNPNTWGRIWRQLVEEGTVIRNPNVPYLKHPSPEWHGREVKCWMRKPG